MEHTIWSVLGLWDIQNEEMHGTTKASPIRKLQLQEEIWKLQALKSKARPRDAYLFIDDVEEYLKKATVYSMTTYISMTKRPIMKSVDRWKRRYDAGVVSIMMWIRQVPGNEKAVKQAEKRARIL